MKRIVWLVGMLIFTFFIFAYAYGASAQNEVTPYRFATLESPNGGQVYLYKSVHEGCEIFVAAGELRPDHNGYATSFGSTVAITTGRGCK